MYGEDTVTRFDQTQVLPKLLNQPVYETFSVADGGVVETRHAEVVALRDGNAWLLLLAHNDGLHTLKVPLQGSHVQTCLPTGVLGKKRNIGVLEKPSEIQECVGRMRGVNGLMLIIRLHL